MTKINENGYSLEDLLKKVTNENIHSEVSSGAQVDGEIW